MEAALRRLSLRRDNYLSEKRFFEEERDRKLAYLAKDEEKESGEGSGGPGTPTESLLSLCSHPSMSNMWSGFSFTSRSYLPEKLQIVKPLEGEYLLESHKLTDSSSEEKEKQNPSLQTFLVGENEILIKSHQLNQKLRQQSNCEVVDVSQSHINQTQTQTLQHQTQYFVFHSYSSSKLFQSASLDTEKLQRSSRSMELLRSPSSQPPAGAPQALAEGLLEVLEQREDALNLQHSFYFRHTQPRCWLEI